MTLATRFLESDLFRVKRFTVDEYHRMGETGIIGPDERVELIEGAIIEMAPIGPPHSGGTIRLTDLFTAQFRGRALASVQGPVRLDHHSEPQPDLMLLKPRDSYYADRPVRPEDVLLAVEVAQSSLRFDLGVKARLYALRGIAELWVLDIKGRRIVVHRQPSDEGYAEIVERKPGDTLNALAFPESEDRFEVAALIGGEA